jgi:hypothetical protein
MVHIIGTGMSSGNSGRRVHPKRRVERCKKSNALSSLKPTSCLTAFFVNGHDQMF